MLNKLIETGNIEKIKKCLIWAKRIVIITHVRPDGDAMGSSLAWMLFLRELGKEANVIVPNACPEFLSWLPSCEDVVNYETQKQQADELIERAELIFYLDLNTPARLGEIETMISKTSAKKILIDHHPDPSTDFYISISHPTASSTSELIFRIICNTGNYSLMTQQIAECIYAGMMTDTGAFTYASNDKDIFFIIAELLSKGVDKDAVYRRVFNNYSFQRMKLMGYVLYEKMKIFPEKKAALITLTSEEFKRFSIVKGDTEGFVNMPLQIKDIVFSCFLRQETEGKINVSLRSVGAFPCNKIATDYFNGGGHKNASGGEFHGTMAEAEAVFMKVLAAI